MKNELKLEFTLEKGHTLVLHNDGMLVALITNTSDDSITLHAEYIESLKHWQLFEKSNTCFISIHFTHYEFDE